ncbi:MAG: recombinase RecT [Bacteroidales bacterium]|nr:recombinase RecT [Bacteroidales bacterium]
MSQSNNQIGQRQNKVPFTVAITTPTYQKLVNGTLSDPKRARQFVAAITSAVSTNPALQECEPGSVLSGALLGESLNLSPSPQLGQYYLVPFKDKKSGTTKATFIPGYKGYIQLALRSGTCRNLDAKEVKEGELIEYDPFTGDVKLQPIKDPKKRANAKTIGYFGIYENISGFRKTMYMSKEEMIIYADTYSSAFSAKAYEKLLKGEIPQNDLWKYSSFWYKNFDVMACKTILRKLCSKWVDMSIEMRNAYLADGATISQDKEGTFTFESSDPVEDDFYTEPSYTVEEEEEIPEAQSETEEPEEISFDEL